MSAFRRWYYSRKIIQKTWKSFACEESCQTIGWEAFKKNQCRAMLSYWYIFAHCSTMNLKSGKPLFLGQKTGGYRLQHNQMWFFTFFSCIHFIYYKILSCVLFCAAIWVSKEHKYNSKPLSLFVHNNVKCTYLQSSALLFFLGEIGFTWRLLQKISSYWYRKSWIGKPLPLCIVVPSLPKALLLLLGRFLLLMLLLPFLVKKNMIM